MKFCLVDVTSQIKNKYSNNFHKYSNLFLYVKLNKYKKLNEFFEKELIFSEKKRE
jgi:hypothetical protein